MTRLIDITLPISPDMLTWPSDPRVSVTPHKTLDDGGSRVALLSLGTHTGTHVDPPYHFLDKGRTVEQLDLQALVGDCVVADLTWVEGHIGPDELDKVELPEGTERLLMRTKNSELWTSSSAPAFPDSYVAMTAEGARWCVERGLRLVGTDFLSVEQRGAAGHPVHTTLLANDVVIVEGLALFGVEAGAYELAVLPLKLVGGDGAPARAVLIQR